VPLPSDWLQGPEEHVELTTNGVRLHAVAAGPKGGPLVIMLHGFPEFWYGWRRQIGSLAAAGYRVLALDQRGYNLSDKPRGRRMYTVDILADDVLGLATALGRETFTVVGHDWGGVLAWHLVSRRPDRIERAVVLNGPRLEVMQAYVSSHLSQARKSWYVGFFQLPWIPEQVLGASNFAPMWRALTETSAPGSFLAEDLKHYRDAWAQPSALTAMLNWYRALPLQSHPRPPERIDVPVRVIWGDRDVALEPALAEASMAGCQRAEVFHLADATHWVQHDRPDEVNRLLLQFLPTMPKQG
jgi:pimeloyl-ACP methyl ester carboxylesterase